MFTIRVRKVVKGIFCIIDKILFVRGYVYVCMSYVFNMFDARNFNQLIKLLDKFMRYEVRSLSDFVSSPYWTA